MSISRQHSVGASAVIFCMPQQGHFNRLLPLISGLSSTGIPTYVYTDIRFREKVEWSGGRFCDLFAGRPIELADAASIPLPCRYVSFAGHYAGQIVREVATLRPGVVIHDSFAVIGTAVANRLSLPRVNVCAGHNFTPSPIAQARQLPRVLISEQCRRAVCKLREYYGVTDANPFSYFSALSPNLNVYCEPPEFLRAKERERFRPVAFFGSLTLDKISTETADASLFGSDSAGRLRIYVSFGTVVWRYYEAEALDALDSIADALSKMDDALAIVSLGGRRPIKRTAGLKRKNIQVKKYVNQWKMLREASVFITHHGLNSTHEAIFHQTPMISYPFFSDQPGLARRCQELGIAVPLVNTLRSPVNPEGVRLALTKVAACRDTMLARLADARRWELDTIHSRGSVIERIVNLMR